MSSHVYKQIELVGSSAVSSDDAIAQATRVLPIRCGTWIGSR
ncbi:dodecin domain protein [Bordetella pertussis STO1-CHOM-0012]|nr:dodecin domain protein [Bordetella pertussis STO1-CHOM-0012]